jgi:hypothetical protein
LTVAPTSGSVSGVGSTNVAFSFDATSLTPGNYSTTVFFVSNDPATPSVPVTACLDVLPAPRATITPDSICVVGFEMGPVVHATATIGNNGAGDLNWRLSDTQGIPAAPGGLRTLGAGVGSGSGSPEPNAKKLEIFKEYLNLPALEPEPGVDLDAKGSDGLRGGVQPYAQGGPDGFGYRFIDSDEAGGPPVDWVEIDGHGGIDSGIHGDDVNLGPFPLGFNMPFYGATFSSVRICSNGWLSFTSTSTSFSNVTIPNTAAPNDLIAPYWEDFDLRNNQGIILYRSEPVLGRFIVEWKNVPRFGAPNDRYTFQAILCVDGSIQYNYQSVTGLLTGGTVGIENSTGTIGLLVVFNAAYIHNNLTTLIQNDQEWLSATPTSGTVAPGGSQNIDVAFDPTGLSLGLHRGYLRINTNDPQVPKKVIPACFDVRETPIAVTLSRFEATSTPDGVSIVWETASETDHSHFDILRSDAGAGSFLKLNAQPIVGDGHYEYQDAGVVDGSSYSYKLEAVDRSGGRQPLGPITITYSGRPAAFALAQNHPNPFSSRTSFRLDLPAAGVVSLRIYDASGRLVKSIVDDQALNGGRYNYEWDGRDDAGNRAAAGFYFLKAETPSTTKTVRMMLAK